MQLEELGPFHVPVIMAELLIKHGEIRDQDVQMLFNL
jgi:hypothetical protein